MNKCLLFIFTWLCIVSCQSGQKKQASVTDSDSALSDTVKTVSAQFPFPEIPLALTSPEERKAYLLTHYWADFDFSDTVLVNNRDVTEQGFVNFIALLVDGNTPETLVDESLKSWCMGFLAQKHARRVMTDMADDYLYNPNSPFYNETLYKGYLEVLLNQLPASDLMRSSYEFKWKLVKRNCVGDKATDFVYFLPDGSRHSLAQTRAKNNRLLLVFYDPECPSCHETMQEMVADGMLAEAVKAGKLTVLAVYTEGNQEVWKRTLSDLPQGWTVGSDHETVKQGALYDLKAMPSLYLLDGTKRVLLKDAPYAKIREEIAAL